jgi:hypothetical protein
MFLDVGKRNAGKIPDLSAVEALTEKIQVLFIMYFFSKTISDNDFFIFSL